MPIEIDPTGASEIHAAPWVTTLHAGGLEPAEPTVNEDLWALPTGDIAALVADVLVQLAADRRDRSWSGASQRVG